MSLCPLCFNVLRLAILNFEFCILNFSQLLIPWYILQKGVLLFVVVDGYAIVLETVGNDEVGYSQDGIVAVNLVDDLACDGHVRLLIFDDHERLKGQYTLTVHHRVASAVHSVHPYRHLISHVGSRVAAMVNEEVDEMLTHPFLRSESHVFLAEHIEYLYSASRFCVFNLEIWKI